MIEITRHGPEAIERVRPFWLALVAYHAAVASEMGPRHDDETSWAMRSAAYREYLAEPGAFLLIAHEDDRDLGYAIVTLDAGSPTFTEPGRYGFIGTLSILPGDRGRGAGRALIDRAQREAEAAGVGELRLDVMWANDAARAFYAALGFTPYLVGLRRPAP